MLPLTEPRPQGRGCLLGPPLWALPSRNRFNHFDFHTLHSLLSLFPKVLRQIILSLAGRPQSLPIIIICQLPLETEMRNLILNSRPLLGQLESSYFLSLEANTCVPTAAVVPRSKLYFLFYPCELDKCYRSQNAHC